MIDVPDQRPPGVGEGSRTVADIAAARLLRNSLIAIGQTVPAWVEELAGAEFRGAVTVAGAAQEESPSNWQGKVLAEMLARLAHAPDLPSQSGIGMTRQVLQSNYRTRPISDEFYQETRFVRDRLHGLKWDVHRAMELEIADAIQASAIPEAVSIAVSHRDWDTASNADDLKNYWSGVRLSISVDVRRDLNGGEILIQMHSRRMPRSPQQDVEDGDQRAESDEQAAEYYAVHLPAESSGRWHRRR